MKVTLKHIDRFNKVSMSGETVYCHICGSADCYTTKIIESPDGDYLVRGYTQDEDGWLCTACNAWMISHGSWVTVALHAILKTKHRIIRVLKWKK